MPDDNAPLGDAALDAIGKRAEAATPGPWRREPILGRPMVVAPSDEDPEFIQFLAEANPARRCGEGDADFIAAARTDVPRLLGEVRRLRKNETWLHALADERKGWIDELKAERQKLRELHAPEVCTFRNTPPGTRRVQCSHCMDSTIAGDEFGVLWPCDTARLVYSPEEIAAIEKGDG